MVFDQNQMPTIGCLTKWYVKFSTLVLRMPNLLITLISDGFRNQVESQLESMMN